MSRPYIRQRTRLQKPADGLEPSAEPAGAGVSSELVGPDAPEPAAAPAYEIGYRKPPIKTRFGADRGNRPGRKRGSKSRLTIIDEELSATVKVAGQGKLPKFRVAIRQLTNKAAAGDLKAIAAIVRMGLDHERARTAEHQSADDAPLSDHEHDIFDIFKDMVREELEAEQPQADPIVEEDGS